MQTLSSIIRDVAEKTGLPQAKVRTILAEFLATTTAAVAEDQRVVLRCFGTFTRKNRKPRKYRDIRTGELKESAPGSTPVFQPSKVLIREMNPSGPQSVRTRESEPREESREPVALRTVIRKTPEEPAVCEEIVSKPNPRQTDNLRILYTPCNAFDSADIYPVVYSPASNALLKLPREGRSDIHGYKEPDFFAELKARLTGISISDDMHLRIPGRLAPYEPDFVLYDESINLYIDVEIDEPYDGFSRLPIHISEGKDTIRDVFFKESGWVVVRFTEKQVHLSSEQCIRTLENIIATMRGEAKPLPQTVLKVS